MPDRIYSDREVAAIIGRAADRQRRTPGHEDVPGLTLAEIERAGREAGLDPALLRSAAADLDAGLLAVGESRPGAAVAERWVEGPLQPGAWEDEVAALRLRFGSSATPVWAGPDVTQLGVDREWATTSTFGVRTTVTLSPRGDRTRIRVVQASSRLANARLEGAALGAFVSVLPALIAGALTAEGLGMGDLAGIVVLLVVLAVGVTLGATLFAERTRRRRARRATDVETLADDLARRLQSDAAAATAPAGPREEPRIDEALLGFEEDMRKEAPEDARTRARRTRD